MQAAETSEQILGRSTESGLRRSSRKIGKSMRHLTIHHWCTMFLHNFPAPRGGCRAFTVSTGERCKNPGDGLCKCHIKYLETHGRLPEQYNRCECGKKVSANVSSCERCDQERAIRRENAETERRLRIERAVVLGWLERERKINVARECAARLIQRTWRRHRKLMDAIVVIQRWWRERMLAPGGLEYRKAEARFYSWFG